MQIEYTGPIETIWQHVNGPATFEQWLENRTTTRNPARWLLIQRRSSSFKSQFISMWDLHYEICLTLFWNWDLDVHLVEWYWWYRK